MRPARVAVLSGGLSLEREVSLRSGRRVAEALSDRGHAVTRLDLDENLVSALDVGDFEVVFLTLHGKAGEDGGVQHLLTVLGLPFTGPDAVASSLAWDKAVCKGLVARNGLSTPDWVALSADAFRELGAARVLDRVVELLGTPLVVKPSQGGASMGVHYVTDVEELAGALLGAFNYHDVALIERFIPGIEAAVSVLDGAPLPVVEIVPKEGRYDFAARYTHGATEFFVPARLDDTTLARCSDTAQRAYDLVGCRHVTRADLVVDDQGVPWLLELDTCPGMTDTSLLPLAAQAAGIEFGALCERLVQRALDDASPRLRAPR